MAGEFAKLVSSVGEFELNPDFSEVDPAALRQLIDRQEKIFCTVVHQARERGDHLASANITAVSWVANTCAMSRNSAADRLCVGKQLESLPQIAQALSSGEIGYQAASVICHLQDKLADKRGPLDEEMWIGFARRLSIHELDHAARVARQLADPNGFARDAFHPTRPSRDEKSARTRIEVGCLIPA